MSRQLIKIELKGMEFFAHHGCFEQERVIGNKFIVDLTVEGDFEKAATTDNLNDTVNYQELYDIVKEEMAVPSNLLENVAQRICAKIMEKSEKIKRLSITIDKINPPLGGKLYASSVTLVYPQC